LGLDNLILNYDNNAVTVDGNIDSCFSEDTSAKLAAQGWHAEEVDDGFNDVSPFIQRKIFALTWPI
jgi:dihydroxyacetone synthase